MGPRIVVISGAASGISHATAMKMSQAGDRVIGIDRLETDIVVDLADASARRTIREQVSALAPDGVDAIVAVAGGPADVNYFGAVDLLEEVRPLLAKSQAPACSRRILLRRSAPR